MQSSLKVALHTHCIVRLLLEVDKEWGAPVQVSSHPRSTGTTLP